MYKTFLVHRPHKQIAGHIWPVGWSLLTLTEARFYRQKTIVGVGRFIYSNCKWTNLKERRDAAWFMFLKNYVGSCMAILMVSSTSLKNVSIGSWTLSSWLRSLEQTIFLSKARWICWFLFEPRKFFFFSLMLILIIIKISPFSSITKHGLRDIMFEDTFPAGHTCSFILFPFTTEIIWPVTNGS